MTNTGNNPNNPASTPTFPVVLPLVVVSAVSEGSVVSVVVVEELVVQVQTFSKNSLEWVVVAVDRGKLRVVKM